MPLSSAFSVSVIAALLLPRDAWCSVHVTHPKDAKLLDWLPGGPQARVHTLPPRIPVTYESNPAHFQYTLYNMKNPEYHAWIRKEHLPLNHKYEEYAYTRDWEPFKKGGESLLQPGETVVAVACSPERLPFVKRMLHHWDGPMALAMYIPYTADSQKAALCRTRVLNYIIQMTQDTTTPFALNLIYANEEQYVMHCDVFSHSTGLESAFVNLQGLKDRYGDKLENYWALYDGLYPINQARNNVISMIQTNAFVMLVDADFVPSGLPGTFHKTLYTDPALKRIRTNWESDKTREVLVVSAWGRMRTNLHTTPESSPCYPESEECWLYQAVDVPYTKASLVNMVKNDEVEPFYNKQYERAYGCVKGVETWLTTEKEYTIDLTQECEPFLIALKDSILPFHPKFRGYQMDKVSQLQYLGEMHYKFTCHPFLFIIHLPHAKSFSTDSAVSLKFPGSHDQWTALRTSLAITLGDYAKEYALEVYHKQGMDEAKAQELATAVGLARTMNVTDYFAGFFPEYDWRGELSAVNLPPQVYH